MIDTINPRVKKVRPAEGYKLQLVFSNDEKKEYDCSPILDFGIFSELKSLQYFNKVFVEDGTVRWPNEQDICPDTLYNESTSFK